MSPTLNETICQGKVHRCTWIPDRWPTRLQRFLPAYISISSTSLYWNFALTFCMKNLFFIERKNSLFPSFSLPCSYCHLSGVFRRAQRKHESELSISKRGPHSREMAVWGDRRGGCFDTNPRIHLVSESGFILHFECPKEHFWFFLCFSGTRRTLWVKCGANMAVKVSAVSRCRLIRRNRWIICWKRLPTPGLLSCCITCPSKFQIWRAIS